MIFFVYSLRFTVYGFSLQFTVYSLQMITVQAIRTSDSCKPLEKPLEQGVRAYDSGKPLEKVMRVRHEGMLSWVFLPIEVIICKL